jgi:predicted Rossmann-fold nucleotide-binding protein
VVSWAQLDLHTKPIGLLGHGYWDGLLEWVDHAVAEGFIAPHLRALIAVDPDLDALLARFTAWTPPVSRWSDAPAP